MWGGLPSQGKLLCEGETSSAFLADFGPSRGFSSLFRLWRLASMSAGLPLQAMPDGSPALDSTQDFSAAAAGLRSCGGDFARLAQAAGDRLLAESSVAATEAATDGKQAPAPVRNQGMGGVCAAGAYAEGLAFSEMEGSRYPLALRFLAFSSARVSAQ